MWLRQHSACYELRIVNDSQSKMAQDTSAANPAVSRKSALGAGTGFRGLVALLIWISGFGRACYGSAFVWDIWFN